MSLCCNNVDISHSTGFLSSDLAVGYLCLCVSRFGQAFSQRSLLFTLKDIFIALNSIIATGLCEGYV